MSRLQGRGPGRLAPSLLVAVALLGCDVPALALDPPLQITQYAHTSWSAREGAMPGLIFAMAQTPDGYLWIAGSYGLFRFDGLRFVPWQPPNGQAMPSGPYSLLAARDGTLWIGTFSGLSSWDGHTFTYRHAEIGMGFVTSMLQARDGTVWVGVRDEPGRLCAIRAGRIQCLVPPEGSFGSAVWSLAQDRSGRLWVGADSGVWRWGPGAPQRFPMPGQRVADLSTTAEGEVLISAEGGGLWQVAGDRLVPFPLRRATSPGTWMADSEIKANKLLRDRDGGLWIGSQSFGLVHVKDGQADTLTRAEGLSGNVACGLFEDREGNIWYGSERGVDRFSKMPVTSLSTRQGLPNDYTNSVLATMDGSVWVATSEGLARWSGDRFVVYTERDGLPSPKVQSQYQDAEGRLWVSTAGGLATFENGRFRAVDGGPSTEIYSITGDEVGNLWLSGNQGLARLYRGRFAENIPWLSLSRTHPAQIVIADRGGLWLAFWDGSGVSYLKDGKLQFTFTYGNGPDLSAVYGLRVDAEGTGWAATGTDGLSRIQDGRASALSVANGLPCNTIHWSTTDAGGALWMYTACGLVRIAPDDLAAWIAQPQHRVTPQVWGAAEGVPLHLSTTGYYGPSVARRPDGKLWFSAGGELQMIDPAGMSSNPVPPPVHIVSLVVDQKSYQATNGLSLPPRSRDIAIQFNALTLVDPKRARFRYRLDGYDDGWHEAIDRRLATYTNLPPGAYRFQVKAANNSGVWNEQGAQLDFSIRPAFYQTGWFRAAVALLSAGLVWTSVQLWMRMRIRRLQRQFEATLDARVAERTRIARELHDTLLQRFHGLLLQFQAAFNLLPDRPRDSKKVLERAIDQVAEAITEGRDTVQGLRASTLETHGLADSLRALADDLAHEHGRAASTRLAVHGTPQALHPLVRDETFRIAGEALRNAFRHADAQQVSVEIHYDAQQLRVCVRDDGKGIEPEVLRAGGKEGHFGLGGMRERAELVGGRLELRSAAGTGTEVEFSAPGARAYGRPAPARPWRWRRRAAVQPGPR